MFKYDHGGDIYAPSLPRGEGQLLDFSANTNPLGLPGGVKKALAAAPASFERYPDPYCRELRAALARRLGVKQDWLLFGNGAADLLYRLAQLIRPACALVLAPSFSDYRRSLASVGCKVRHYHLQEKLGFALPISFLENIKPEYQCVYLCNPNNPTGLLLSQQLLEAVLDRCRECNSYLILDECFMDLVDPKEAYSLVKRLSDYPRLIILKAFTKTYAMAGLRLGYLLSADGKLLNQLRLSAQAWSVSGPAQVAGLAALKEEGYLEQTWACLAKERNYLCSQLSQLGLKVYGASANYLLFRLAWNLDLKALLLERGILVRSCANYPGLDSHYYRIAIKKRRENLLLVQALRKILQDAVTTLAT